MPEPRIKRYALVRTPGDDGVRRFHLARVAGGAGALPREERLERLEEIAARERARNGSRPHPRDGDH